MKITEEMLGENFDIVTVNPKSATSAPIIASIDDDSYWMITSFEYRTVNSFYINHDNSNLESAYKKFSKIFENNIVTNKYSCKISFEKFKEIFKDYKERDIYCEWVDVKDVVKCESTNPLTITINAINDELNDYPIIDNGSATTPVQGKIIRPKPVRFTTLPKKL